MKKFLLFLAILFSLSINAQYIKLLDFKGAAKGSYPECDLISDGTYLYGTTTEGGPYVRGTIFRVKPNGSGYVMLHDFQLGNGYPYGSLFSDGTFLYGTTEEGGANYKGSIYKIKPDGTAFTILQSFNDTNGALPMGTLIFDGTFLYGTTNAGGSTGNGIIYKIKPDGTAFDTLLSFNNTNGRNPIGALVYDGTFLYGTTNLGGAYNMGLVYKIKTNGTGFDTLISFNGTNGANPNAALVYNGNSLYGTTVNGGTNNLGVIYKINLNGSGYATLYNFSATSGANPFGALNFNGDHLYGTTSIGGIGNNGVIFRIRPDGTNYTKLFDCSTPANGINPQASLMSDGTYFYGTAYRGGVNANGVLFKIKIPVVTTSQHLTICAGQNLTVGPHTYSLTGIYVDTLTAVQDCDSIVTTHLTVLSSSSTSAQTLTICSNQSASVGSDVYTTSGSYTYTFSGGGCDSVVITNIIVNPSPTVTISGNNNLCANNNNGTTLTASGSGTYSWSTGSQMSSISIAPTTNTNYSVIATLGSCTDTSSVTITVNNVTAAFNYSNVTCQCAVIGFMDSSYVSAYDSIVTWDWSFPGGNPSNSHVQNPGGVNFSTGNHYVCLKVATVNGCTDSICKNVFELMSIDEFRNPLFINIYPNPNNGTFNIETNVTEKQNMQLFDVNGKLVLTQTINTKATVINASQLAEGVYNISIISNEGVVNKKLVIVK